MQFLAPAAAVGLLAIPAILLLYFLKVRRPEVTVSSLLFWRPHVMDRQANAPWQRLRPSLLLFIQLLVAAALAMALMRPAVAGSESAARTTVVLIDGSPTMQATDVNPSRFGLAVDLAGKLTKEVGGNKKMAVAVLGPHPRLLTPPTGDANAIRKALKRARPSSAPANLEEGISLADGILAGRPGAAVILISDGHYEPPPTTPRLSGSLAYWSVGSSGENAALEAIGRQPDGQVFIRVLNLGRQSRQVDVEVRADGRLVDVLPLRVDGSSSAETRWGGFRAGTTVLEARLTPTDAFALDDAAWFVTEPPTRRRALLVTPGNGFLQRALSLRSELDITVVAPEQYQPGEYDLYVFDQFVPQGPVPNPALVIAPPQGQGPLEAHKTKDPGALLPANPREPLLRYVNLRDVHVQASSEVVPLAGWQTVIAAANGPLLLVHHGEPRIAQITFDIHRSDLPLRPAFPILIQNLVQFLLPGGFENREFPLGEPVRLATRAGVTSIEVTPPSGKPQVLPPPFPATFSDTGVPGVYTVRETSPGGTSVSRFVVHHPVPDGSRISPGAGPSVEAASRQAPPPTQKGINEIWMWVAGLALLVLAVEWVVFLRA